MFKKTNKIDTTIIFLTIHIIFFLSVVSKINIGTIEESELVFFGLYYIFSLFIYVKEMFSTYPSTFPYLLLSYVPGTNIVIFIWEVLSSIVVLVFSENKTRQS